LVIYGRRVNFKGGVVNNTLLLLFINKFVFNSVFYAHYAVLVAPKSKISIVRCTDLQSLKWTCHPLLRKGRSPPCSCMNSSLQAAKMEFIFQRGSFESYLAAAAAAIRSTCCTMGQLTAELTEHLLFRNIGNHRWHGCKSGSQLSKDDQSVLG
jgi:hypothetical protein